MEPVRLGVFPQKVGNGFDEGQLIHFGLILFGAGYGVQRPDRSVEMGSRNRRAKAVQLHQAANKHVFKQSHFHHFCHFTL